MFNIVNSVRPVAVLEAPAFSEETHAKQQSQQQYLLQRKMYR